jgi:phage terminase small subunit
MTDRQQAFVWHYLATRNAADAARRAGYSARVADREGYRLLRNAEIQAAVQEGRAKLLAHVELTAQRVLEEVGRIALFDIAKLFDAEGHPLPVHDWPVEAHAAVASVKVVTRRSPASDGQVDTVYEVKLLDKLRALELAATHLGLLKKKVEHSGGIDLVERLRAARQRGRAA